jgi:hypothetical protein
VGMQLKVLKNLANSHHNAFDIFEHIVIRKAQHAIALLLKPSIARGVAFSGDVVRIAVEFNDNFVRSAQKVADERADGHLAIEACAELFGVEKGPQTSFGPCCLAA